MRGERGCKHPVPAAFQRDPPSCESGASLAAGPSLLGSISSAQAICSSVTWTHKAANPHSRAKNFFEISLIDSVLLAVSTSLTLSTMLSNPCVEPKNPLVTVVN